MNPINLEDKLNSIDDRVHVAKGGDIVLINNLKVGDTVTDGYRTYVLDRDHELHYVGSGNHAKYHVSQEELKKELLKWQ